VTKWSGQIRPRVSPAYRKAHTAAQRA